MEAWKNSVRKFQAADCGIEMRRKSIWLTENGVWKSVIKMNRTHSVGNCIVSIAQP